MLRTNSISGRRVHAPRQPWQRPLHAPRQQRCRSRSCSYCTRRGSCCHGSGRCMPHSSCVVAAAAAAIAYCTRAGAAAPTAMAAAVATCCSYCTRHSNCCHGHGSGHWTCCMRSGSCCHSCGSGRCVARTMSCRQSHGRHGRVAVAAMAAAVTRATAAAVAAMAAVDACAMAAALSQLQLQRLHAPQQLLLQPRQRPPHGLHAPRSCCHSRTSGRCMRHSSCAVACATIAALAATAAAVRAAVRPAPRQLLSQSRLQLLHAPRQQLWQSRPRPWQQPCGSSHCMRHDSCCRGRSCSYCTRNGR